MSRSGLCKAGKHTNFKIIFCHQHSGNIVFWDVSLMLRIFQYFCREIRGITGGNLSEIATPKRKVSIGLKIFFTTIVSTAGKF